VPALLEAVQQRLPAIDPDAQVAGNSADDGIRVAIVGRPNVGKSTLVNRSARRGTRHRSEVAGTTRDSIRVRLERDGKRYTLIDTAGVAAARVEEAVEKFSVIKMLQSTPRPMSRCLPDAHEGVSRTGCDRDRPCPEFRSRARDRSEQVGQPDDL
jgi:GTP-binding protein